MTVEVYSNPGCRPCKESKNLLAANGVPFTEIDIATGDGALDLVQSLGFRAAPVVILRDTTNAIKDAWSGFNYEKLAALA